MNAPELPKNENERLSALQRLNILDTEAEERFDRITRVASTHFNVPIALVSLIDANRQWFKSCVGLDASETSREVSFCGHAILQEDVFVINDATQDDRFKDNPLVTGDPHVIFYAGVPLTTLDGTHPGTLCLIDNKPRDFTEGDKAFLKDLAKWVEVEMNIHDTKNLVDEIENEKHKLIETKTRLELATKCAGIGIWDWDVTNNILIWDEKMYDLYGVTREAFSGAYEAWQNGLHPEDKDRAVAELQAALDGEDEFDTTFRVVHPDGAIRYIRAFGRVDRDEAKNHLKVVGVNYDISEDKEIDKAKTEFVSLASHQLRTPLATINWYLELLEDPDEGFESLSEDQKKYISQINHSNERMTELVNALLNVSRIDVQDYAIQAQDTDVVSIAEDVFAEVQNKTNEKRLIIKKEFSSDSIMMFSDPTLLRIIFQNLLTNAVKYTPEDGTVTLQIKHDNASGYDIEVSDTGIGIPESDKKNIFSKLFRAENARKSEIEGTGLGIYIMKSIIEEAGGTVSFESEVHKGTTFYVHFPSNGMTERESTRKLDYQSKAV